MGSSGNITSYLDYHDGVNSAPLNQRFINRFPVGIYSGADLGIVSNTSASVSAFDLEITDGTYVLKATSSASNNVTVSTVNVWVVARWSYTGTANDVPSLLGVSTTLTNDLIIGKCVFSGSTLTGFDLTKKTDAPTFQKFCLVEQTGTPGMQVKIRAGNLASSTQTYTIVEQLTSSFTAPVSNPRIDVVCINSSGNVTVITGTENASPSAPSYANNVPLAQITLQTSTTSITNSMIVDVRPFLANTAVFVDLSSNQSIAGTKTFTGSLVIPAVTSDPGSPVNGQIWLRTDF